MRRPMSARLTSGRADAEGSRWENSPVKLTVIVLLILGLSDHTSFS